MTVITNNSITGINSITAQASTLNFYDTNGGQISIGASITGNVTGDVTGNVTGDITIGAGSTSAPSLAPSGDSNTGVFFPSADTIAFAEGGSEAARIDSSGRLLVGTNTAVTTIQRVSSSDTPAFQYQGEHLSIRRTDDQPYFSLVKGNTVVNNAGTGRINFQGYDGSNHLSTASIYSAVDGAPGTDDMPGRLVFATTSDSGTSPTERMRINNVGGLKVASGGASLVSSSTNAGQVIATDNDGLEALYVTNRNSVSPVGVQIYYSTDLNNTANYFLTCYGTSNLRAGFRSNGGLANYQSNNVNLCDEREKKNIVNLDSTWDCLKHWELKKFHYNEDADDADLRYGVIAQQVAPHCPEVISDWVKQQSKKEVLDEDGNVVTPAVEEIVRMGVKEQQMMWMAIKALQEAQTRIEELETQNAAILARLDALEGN